MSTRFADTQRRKPLSGAVATLLAISAPAICANTITVTRCDDQNHIGDLRHGVAGAGDGDTVDMSALVCPSSRISLQLGQLATSHNITLLGPGKDNLTITGKYYSSPSSFTTQPYRILAHTGTGTLTIENVSLTAGYARGFEVSGGCVYSAGSVTLDHAGIYFCRAKATASGGIAFGGGLDVRHDLTLIYSSISGNTAEAGGGTLTSRAGGAYVGGDFYAIHSRISGNSAIGAGSSASWIGGLAFTGNGTIFASTISGNTAQGPFGGVLMFASPGTSALIGNSTISGNTSITGKAGGIFTPKDTTINNSTIVFNTAQLGVDAPGLATTGPSVGSTTINLYSTLIANNTYGPTAIENDVSASNGTSSTVTISGSENLVRVATVSLPVGTITGACPLLGPLRDNGGPTLTHALLSHSPGIDQGSNINSLVNDQRGPPYARQSGVAADIGAYEVQKDEIVFDAGFDGCP